MKKFLLSLCMLPMLAFAQSPSGSIITFSGGYANYDVTDYSVFMPDSNLAIANDGFVYAFGFDGIKNRMLFGISFSSMIQPKYTSDSIDIQFLNSDIKLDIGYGLIMKPRFLLAPVLGLGGGTDLINFMSNTNTTAAGVASNPGRELHLTQGKALADISLQMYWMLGDPAESFDNEGFAIGLQAGYTANYAIGNWNYQTASVTDGPEGFRSMIYARLSIGLLSLKNLSPAAPSEEMQ